MSMTALNQLVARSIIDPNVLRAFQAGRINDVLEDLGFSGDLRERLEALQASTFAEFSVLAYRLVKAAEQPVPRIELPSPLEGLIASNDKDSEEQVA